VSVPVERDLSLVSWMRDGRRSPDGPLVVVFPGNAGNRATRLPLGNGLAERGFCVMLGEYRGYGGNAGSPDEASLIGDGRAMVDAARHSCGGVSGIVYFGESLGAAVAVGVAVDDPPDALILGSPFTSLVDVGRLHHPLLPVAAVLRDRYATMERVASGGPAGVPALVIAGTADRVVPVEQSRAVAGALGAVMYEIEGADHNDASLRSGPGVVDGTARFIRDVLGEAEEGTSGTAVRP
jgi:fermentation-respiration switch protein FrsA (DUF1100 family)